MIHVIKNSKLWLGFSSALVIASLVLIFTVGLNPSADFVAGTTMKLNLGANPSADQVSEYIENDIYPALSQDLGDADVRMIAGSQIMIRTQEMTTETQETFTDMLDSQFGGIGENLEIRNVSPVFAREFMLKSLRAFAYAAMALIIYLAISFRNKRTDGIGWHITVACVIAFLALIAESKTGNTLWIMFGINCAIFAAFLILELMHRSYSLKFGIIAILALLHDVLIVCGVFVILGVVLGIEVDALFITALLTIIGYSVNDTIVVFDRVRENLHSMSGQESFASIADKSVNQSVARSINTSLSTLITLLCLFFLGSQSIQWFIFALICGTVVGTYSSIFVATPLLALWQKRYK